ncbi:MAG: DinB family protein [Bacteroidota bacterium]
MSKPVKTSDIASDEYHPYYAPYIECLGDVDLHTTLVLSKHDFIDFIASIDDNKLAYAYKEGKWTLAEVLVHLLDAERIFQYRALRFARNDQTELPGFDQDSYVPESLAHKKSKNEIAEEYAAVRNASVSLFNALDDVQLSQSGIASGVRMSVRALGFVICGHQKHHLNIVRERYL